MSRSKPWFPTLWPVVALAVVGVLAYVTVKERADLAHDELAEMKTRLAKLTNDVEMLERSASDSPQTAPRPVGPPVSTRVGKLRWRLPPGRSWGTDDHAYVQAAVKVIAGPYEATTAKIPPIPGRAIVAQLFISPAGRVTRLQWVKPPAEPKLEAALARMLKSADLPAPPEAMAKDLGELGLQIQYESGPRGSPSGPL